MNISHSDIFFLKQTLQLAKRGEGWVNPNPMVGAVIVNYGKISGKGHHRRWGLPHAEIEAISSCTESTKGATLYANLEPCVRVGRTQPCVDSIIYSGIKRVVCATLDPSLIQHGLGVATLKDAGIEVTIGGIEDEARKLNEAFFTFHQKKRPFIAVKFAASLDGKIATSTGDSKWITGQRAREYARKLRGKYQAICVGATTVVRDNPHLGIRTKGLRDPFRIVLDPHLRTSPASQVYRDENAMIFISKSIDPGKKVVFERKGIQVVPVSSYPFDIKEIMHYLYGQEIVSILVEGGATTLGSFFDAKLVDKVYAFNSPIIIGGKNGLSAIGGEGATFVKNAHRLKQITRKQFGDDQLTVGYL